MGLCVNLPYTLSTKLKMSPTTSPRASRNPTPSDPTLPFTPSRNPTCPSTPSHEQRHSPASRNYTPPPTLSREPTRSPTPRDPTHPPSEPTRSPTRDLTLPPTPSHNPTLPSTPTLSREPTPTPRDPTHPPSEPTRSPSPRRGPVLDLRNPYANLSTDTHAERRPDLLHQGIRTLTKKTLTEAQKATRALRQISDKEKNALLTTDLEELLMTQYIELENLAKKHAVKVEYIQNLIRQSSHFKKKRAVSLHNAILHHKAADINAGKLIIQSEVRSNL